MSNLRHVAQACPPLPSPVTALTYEFEAGHTIPLHHHPEDQLVYASRGVMTVRTDGGTWVVPSQRAVWIPARTPHSIVISGAASMRTIYFRAQMVRCLRRTCWVINVSPLLRELIQHACTYPQLNRRSRSHRHLIDFILDQLKTLKSVPLQLPNLSDPRAVRVADALRRYPSNECSVEQLCRNAGACKRTLERLFLAETGMTIGRWRQQLRLQRSLELLASGEKVTHAAMEAGYSTPSAFIAMFRSALGTTPGRYFEGTRTAS